MLSGDGASGATVSRSLTVLFVFDTPTPVATQRASCAFARFTRYEAS
jgi:hypothetical protein